MTTDDTPGRPFEHNSKAAQSTKAQISGYVAAQMAFQHCTCVYSVLIFAQRIKKKFRVDGLPALNQQGEPIGWILRIRFIFLTPACPKAYKTCNYAHTGKVRGKVQLRLVEVRLGSG